VTGRPDPAEEGADLATAGDVAVAIGKNQWTPEGPARIARAEQLVEAAGRTRDRPVIIKALQDLIHAYTFGGLRDKLVIPFGRVLDMWDNRPSDFDTSAKFTLCRQFKWAADVKIYDPDVPLATLRDFLHTMGRHHAQNGHRQRSMYSCLVRLEQFRGDKQAAQAAYDRRRQNANDRVSDCWACQSDFDGDWHEWNGRDDEALAAWRRVLDNPLIEGEEPHQLRQILSKSLLPLVRLGRPGQARANHLLGYRMVRGDPNLRPSVGRHLEYAALSGNEDRALEILNEHAAWLARGDESTIVRLSFLEAVGLLLRRLNALGRDDVRVTTPDGFSPASELRPRVEEELAAITAAYDARNGTTAVSDRTAARLGRAPLLEPLVSGSRVGPLPTGTSAPPVMSTEDSGQLALRTAETIWAEGGRDDAVVDFALLAADRLREYHPGGAARATALAGCALQRQGRAGATQAVTLIEEALPGLERHHDDSEIIRARRSLQLALTDLERHDDAADVARSTAALADGRPDKREQASLAYQLGQALAADWNDKEAVPAYERAMALWHEAGELPDYVRATRAAAWCRWRQTPPDWSGALAQLRAAQAVSAGADDPAVVAEHHQTTHEIAQLLQCRTRVRGCPEGTAEEALAEADAAADGFAKIGERSKAKAARSVADQLRYALGRAGATGSSATGRHV
jgi:tetratricopeptide (TPR) repeat protein